MEYFCHSADQKRAGGREKGTRDQKGRRQRRNPQHKIKGTEIQRKTAQNNMKVLFSLLLLLRNFVPLLFFLCIPLCFACFSVLFLFIPWGLLLCCFFCSVLLVFSLFIIRILHPLPHGFVFVFFFFSFLWGLLTDPENLIILGSGN